MQRRDKKTETVINTKTKEMSEKTEFLSKEREMLRLDLTKLTHMLRYWSNECPPHKEDRGLNEYEWEFFNYGGVFILKWVVLKEDFDQLVIDLNYQLEEDKTRIFLDYGDTGVEIEIDKRGRINKSLEGLEEMSHIFDEIPDLNDTQPKTMNDGNLESN